MLVLCCGSVDVHQYQSSHVPVLLTLEELDTTPSARLNCICVSHLPETVLVNHNKNSLLKQDLLTQFAS